MSEKKQDSHRLITWATCILAIMAIIQGWTLGLTLRAQGRANRIQEASLAVMEAQMFPCVYFKLTPDKLNIWNTGITAFDLNDVVVKRSDDGSKVITKKGRATLTPKQVHWVDLNDYHKQRISEVQQVDLKRLDLTCEIQTPDGKDFRASAVFAYDTNEKKWITVPKVTERKNLTNQK